MRSGSNVALKFIPLIWNENLKKFLNSVQPSDNNIYHPLKNRHTLCVCVCVCVCTVVQFCPTLFDPMDYSLPGSSVHGIFHARILEQVAISYSMGSSQPRNQTRISCISCIGRQIFFFNHCPTLGSPLFKCPYLIQVSISLWWYVYIYTYTLEKEMTTHCNILCWGIPWTEEPGGLQSMGSQESDTT